MAWRIFASRFKTADFSGSIVHYQNFTPTVDFSLKAIQSWFVLYNNPTWTSLRFDIYSVKNSVPYQLLWQSDENTPDADALLTHENGAKALYFAFSKPPQLKGGDHYALVPRFSSYTGDADSHIAWRIAFPRKVYEHFATLQYRNELGKYPHDFTLVVSEL